MRVSRWKAKEVLLEVWQQARSNAIGVMDEVVQEAKRTCPVDPATFREGRFGSANISFTPRTGRHKGKLVEFSTEKRWMGREPGNLRDTIRLKTLKSDESSIRVYAGNFKIYWALFIERGYHDRSGKYHAGRHFLRNALNSKRATMLSKIKEGT
jgi:hypothetical protein